MLGIAAFFAASKNMLIVVISALHPMMSHGDLSGMAMR
jgi:hypothetical protein